MVDGIAPYTPFAYGIQQNFGDGWWKGDSKDSILSDLMRQ